ncbi:MAG: AbrB/MazE/SpoVT family DNA-binding domain-containing protein [Bryobacteraceae bacterium]|jgi:AbrB family looped-hinge helix DNA binding protein
MPTATVTSKGQITIPAEVRKALNLEPGDRIDIFEVENGRFALTARNKSIRDLEGCVPKLDYVPTIEELNEAVGAAVAENVRRSLERPSEGTSKDEAA